MDEPLTPVQPTEDMKLPPGSGVLQIIFAPLEDGTPNLDIRGVLIGGPDGAPAYDPLNPVHRLLAVINNRMDELVAEATGGAATRRTDAGVIERRLHEGEQPGAIPEEGLDAAVLDELPTAYQTAYQAGSVALAQLDHAVQHERAKLANGVTDPTQQSKRQELTETEAVRQHKLAKLAAMYGGEADKVALKVGPDGNPAPVEPFELAPRAEGKGGSGLHPDD